MQEPVSYTHLDVYKRQPFDRNNEKDFSKGKKDAAGTVTVYRRRKRSYLFVALAAVFVLVLGSGLTSVGSKSYWKELWNNFVGDEKVSGIDVEDMEKQETDDLSLIHI